MKHSHYLPTNTGFPFRFAIQNTDHETAVSLEPGKLADLVILSRDILAAGERDRIAKTEVLLTMVGGKVVFERFR